MSVQAKTIAEKGPKKVKLSLERKQSLYGYIFVLPIILGFAFIYLPVLVQSFIYSISEINIDNKKGFTTVFTGWNNYNEALFVEEGFLRTVIEATMSLLPQIFIIIIFAFFMANVLNQNFRGRTVARVIFFVPVVISTGVIAYFDKMNTMLDVYNQQGKMEIGGAGGGGMNIFNYAQLRQIVTLALNNQDLSNIVLGAVDGLYGVITSSGVQMLIFLAGLQSISINMYEAAKVEGATGWEVFWKISFPMISPLILVNLIYTVIDLFLKSDNAAIAYINAQMEDASTYELASALSWIYTLVVLLFVAAVWLIVKKLVVYQD